MDDLISEKLEQALKERIRLKIEESGANLTKKQITEITNEAFAVIKDCEDYAMFWAILNFTENNAIDLAMRRVVP